MTKMANLRIVFLLVVVYVFMIAVDSKVKNKGKTKICGASQLNKCGPPKTGKPRYCQCPKGKECKKQSKKSTKPFVCKAGKKKCALMSNSKNEIGKLTKKIVDFYEKDKGRSTSLMKSNIVKGCECKKKTKNCKKKSRHCRKYIEKHLSCYIAKNKSKPCSLKSNMYQLNKFDVIPRYKNCEKKRKSCKGMPCLVHALYEYCLPDQFSRSKCIVGKISNKDLAKIGKKDDVIGAVALFVCQITKACKLQNYAEYSSSCEGPEKDSEMRFRVSEVETCYETGGTYVEDEYKYRRLQIVAVFVGYQNCKFFLDYMTWFWTDEEYNLPQMQCTMRSARRAHSACPIEARSEVKSGCGGTDITHVVTTLQWGNRPSSRDNPINPWPLGMKCDPDGEKLELKIKNTAAENAKKIQLKYGGEHCYDVGDIINDKAIISKGATLTIDDTKSDCADEQRSDRVLHVLIYEERAYPLYPWAMASVQIYRYGYDYRFEDRTCHVSSVLTKPQYIDEDGQMTVTSKSGHTYPEDVIYNMSVQFQINSRVQ